MSYRPTNGDGGVFGDDRPQLPDIPYRRIFRWSVVVAGIIILFVVLNTAKNIYTDWLWFDALGYKSVYTTRLWTRVWLFFAGAGLFTGLFLINARIALRLARRDEPAILPPDTIVLIRSLTRTGIVVVVLIFALVFGSVASGQWENYLRFTNVVPFVDSSGVSISDPLWGHNPSFYVFQIPFLRFLQTWTLGVILMLMVGSIAIYAVGFSMRGFKMDFTRGVKLHLGILAALFLLNLGWSYWFDIQELTLSSRGLGGTLLGANATDVTAKLFALRFMMAITALLAVAAIANAFLRLPRLPLAGFGVWLLSIIIVSTIYPALYQRFSVEPSELARETPYIERNIAMTREAYGLTDIEVRPFPTSASLTPEEVFGNPNTINNIRLWDHRPLRDTYNQIQFLRPYYTFTDVDVDRYEIDGETRQVMLAARELAPENLPDEAQSWVAQRLSYTHGYGVAMSPVTEFTEEGRPDFILKDIPPQGPIEVDRPELYYAERSRSYVIVGTKTQEFDFPTEQDTPMFTDYEGEGGVELSSFLRKLAFAWRMGDFNILISSELTSDSKILFFRHIQDRIERIAPFLALDSDPYLVVADGKMWWIQDAYTTTQRFPYSSRYRDGFNYIRNSVKVVVDAYHGSVTLYVMEPEDALVQTYSKVFPDLFSPLSEMPPSLRDHIRYPEGLFTVQEEIYRLYHVTDPRVFFTKEDTWSRPTELFYNTGQPMEAYYVSMPLPGEEEEEFLLLIPFTPLDRNNLVAWLAARSDGENYGELVAYTFAKDRQVDGPRQVEARIDNDPTISQQFSLWDQQGSSIIRGNLLVIPLESSLLYVEPVYLQASTLNFPELKRVIVAIGDERPVMEPTLRRSLEVALGQAAPSGILSNLRGGDPPPRPVPTPAPTPGPSVPQPMPEPGVPQTDIDAVIEQVEVLLEQLRQLRDR